MQLSETVLAAMIGAIATVSTALFQIFTALRARNKLEVRPKKGRTFRSVVAIFALVIASGVGGYLYAGMRQQSANEDLRSLREELNAKLQLLAATTERIAQAREQSTAPPAFSATPTLSTEAVVFASECLAGAQCAEAAAQRLMLCGAIPANMQVRKLDLFAKSAKSNVSWEQAAVSFEQDLGGAKFRGAPIEHPQDEHRKAVCVDFAHWSQEAHLARMVIQYGAAVEAPSLQHQTAQNQNAPAETSVAASGTVPATQGMAIAAPAMVQ